MKKKLPIFLVASAIALFAGSAAGTTQAALAYFSENYLAQVDVKSIGVSLVENGKDISWRDYMHKDDAWSVGSGVLLENLLTDSGDEHIVLNKKYKEELSVRNSGTIDEYVRVTVSKYWLDGDGETKRTDLDPDSIDLNFTENGWIEDKSAATSERTVLYYGSILGSGESSPLFTDTLTIKDVVAKKVTNNTYVDEQGYTVIETVYDYDGLQFIIKADVDAVQTHNAKEAIKSAWGVDVSVSENGSLSLN